MEADVREIIKKLCDYRNIEIVEGAVCADHVHLCLSIPPSEKVSDVVGYIKGKSALMIHDKYPESVNGWSKAFWARGYYVDTVGKNTKAIDAYISNQLKEVEVVMKSEALLIAHPSLSSEKQSILDELLFRFEAIQQAEGKK